MMCFPVQELAEILFQSQWKKCHPLPITGVAEEANGFVLPPIMEKWL
jgi:hypothetical protein